MSTRRRRSVTQAEKRRRNVRAADARDLPGAHPMSERWRNFTERELHDIAALLPPLGGSAPSIQCPVCKAHCVRWYHYRNPYRTQSKISYVWCSNCRRYHGQTTLQERWNLPDPLDDAPESRELEMKDLAAYFAELDRLWDVGELPQHEVGRGGAASDGPGAP
jgi:hypothetical protein